MTGSLNQWINRAAGSRWARRWYQTLSLEERALFLLRVWRGLEHGFDYAQQYTLLRNIFKSKLGLYPVVSSVDLLRIYGFFRLLEDLKTVEGEIVECGVGRGVSLSYLVYATLFFDLDKTVYAFDSFSGFPPAAPQDLGARVVEAGVAPSGWTNTSPELIRQIFDLDQLDFGSLIAGRDLPLKIVPGFFEQTLPGSLPEKIAFLHADADLYDSTQTILQHCLPRMAANSIVIFDEYHDPRWPGVRKAVDEMCAERGLSVKYFAPVQRYGIQFPP